MVFYLTTMGFARFLSEAAPVVSEDDTDVQRRMAYYHWINTDFLCRNYVLDGLDNYLYMVYQIKKTAKELWEFLEKKYKVDGASSRQFLASKMLDFVMVDSRSVVSQVQEYQVLLQQMQGEGLHMAESLQVATTIHKLPPS